MYCQYLSKRMGRPLTLGHLETEVQQYVQALYQAGTPVGSAEITDRTKGIVMSVDHTLLAENGGHI